MATSLLDVSGEETTALSTTAGCCLSVQLAVFTNITIENAEEVCSAAHVDLQRNVAFEIPITLLSVLVTALGGTPGTGSLQDPGLISIPFHRRFSHIKTVAV